MAAWAPGLQRPIAPAMVRAGHGAIVNVGSINGLIGMAGSALYSATKATVHSPTKSWAAEYGPFGVRVNTVAPGPTATERNVEHAGRVAPFLARIPSRRMSTPAEVAAAVVFLASDPLRRRGVGGGVTGRPGARITSERAGGAACDGPRRGRIPRAGPSLKSKSC